MPFFILSSPILVPYLISRIEIKKLEELITKVEKPEVNFYFVVLLNKFSPSALHNNSENA